MKRKEEKGSQSPQAAATRDAWGILTQAQGACQRWISSGRNENHWHGQKHHLHSKPRGLRLQASDALQEKWGEQKATGNAEARSAVLEEDQQVHAVQKGATSFHSSTSQHTNKKAEKAGEE